MCVRAFIVIATTCKRSAAETPYCSIEDHNGQKRCVDVELVVMAVRVDSDESVETARMKLPSGFQSQESESEPRPRSCACEWNSGGMNGHDWAPFGASDEESNDENWAAFSPKSSSGGKWTSSDSTANGQSWTASFETIHPLAVDSSGSVSGKEVDPDWQDFTCSGDLSSKKGGGASSPFTDLTSNLYSSSLHNGNQDFKPRSLSLPLVPQQLWRPASPVITLSSGGTFRDCFHASSIGKVDSSEETPGSLPSIQSLIDERCRGHGIVGCRSYLASFPGSPPSEQRVWELG